MLIRVHLLLHQKAGDLVSVVALDADGLGTKEVFWWKKHYPRAKWWPVPEGKDPTEAMQAGLSIRLWVCAGLRSCEEIPRPSPPDRSVAVKSCVLNQGSTTSRRGDDTKVVFIDQTPYSRAEIDRLKNP